MNKEEIKSSKYGLWKGDDIKYQQAHSWLNRHYPRRNVCVICGRICHTDYAYLGQNGKHSRRIGDYLELCGKCHAELDNHPGEKEKIIEVLDGLWRDLCMSKKSTT